ncbi:PP2C family protein-serine/threonine phosphatase [Streptomyces cylindrosporus]|uniref:Serine/threonine-protein phosphatase n=1 Tax=Streptomyces cylindrosporus TaxID=2927583 RepID=A0ABS9YD04_9ACTN|nr:PP2C family protein-serine/threonine phosphatase [Streptomyces cylindrosporus]MCI3274829.1 serine/threonine-protein phosphatase [Streptomyces cylindrosporus]
MLDRLPRAGHEDALRRHQLLRVRGRSVAWVAPFLLLLCITFVDFNTTGEFRIISWIVLVPGIAAAICGVWGTAVFAVLAVVTYVVADQAWPHQYQTGLPDFILVAVGGILAVLACSVRVRGERRMLHMRDVAETTRRTVLRPLPADWGGLEHAAVYLPSDVEARVGGDFYDIQPGPHGTRVLIGDVQGKGLGAVEAAAALLGTFREAAYHEADLATVADRLETRMLRHRGHTTALGREDGDRFATAALIGFPEDDEGAVDVVLFGHDPPLVAGPAGVRQLPPGDGLPLGLGELAGDGPPPVRRVPLATGETLLLTTDGVTEARDGDGEFYPLAADLARAVAAEPRVTEPRRLVAFVRDRTLRHCAGRLADDTTVFAVRRRAPEARLCSRSGYGADVSDRRGLGRER